MNITKVLYFTVVNLAKTDNGGGLACRNHARRLANIAGVELTICCATWQEDYNGIKTFADSLGANLEFIPFVATDERPLLQNEMLWEAEAVRQAHTDTSINRIIDRLNIGTLVVDYLYSAFFVRSAYRRSDIRRITITLNREVEFMRDMHRKGLLGSKSRKSARISELRLMLAEQTIYSRSHVVVSLTKRDLPFPRPTVRRKVVVPVFDPQTQRWSGARNRSLFFIGNIGHFPNYEAIEWLVRRLAPELLLIGSDSVIDIIGATAEQMAACPAPGNVRFHGNADAPEALRMFTSCGLFIAPIKNPYGSKMKVLDSLSYGTPLVATRAALSGLPAIDDIPLISLEDPAEAASIIDGLLADESRRTALSSGLARKLDQLLARQHDLWEKIIT